MAINLFFRSTVLSVALIPLLMAGCESSNAASDDKMADLRAAYLLADEPEGAISVAEAKAAAKDGKPFVLFARIGIEGYDTWQPGKATFVVSDPVAFLDINEGDHQHADGDGHDHSNCPFCNKKVDVSETMAVIQFVDANGELLAVDAQQLFELQKDQMVVVSGRGEVDSLGNLFVTADGIYIRR